MYKKDVVGMPQNQLWMACNEEGLLCCRVPSCNIVQRLAFHFVSSECFLTTETDMVLWVIRWAEIVLEENGEQRTLEDSKACTSIIEQLKEDC